MRHRLFVTAASLLFCHCLTACESQPLKSQAKGGRDAGGDAGATAEPPLELDEYASRLADALCSAAQTCCGTRGLDVDVEACTSDATTQNATELMARAALAVNYDPVAASRCVTAFEATLTSCRFFGDELSRPPCDDVFIGQLGAGEPCSDDLECAPIDGQPAFCDSDIDSDLSVCAPRLSENDTCFGPGCSDGLYCDLYSVSCKPQISSGQCLLISACTDDTVCSPRAECEPKLPDGVPCQLDIQCSGGICDVTGLCASTLTSDFVCLGAN